MTRRVERALWLSAGIVIGWAVSLAGRIAAFTLIEPHYTIEIEHLSPTRPAPPPRPILPPSAGT